MIGVGDITLIDASIPQCSDLIGASTDPNAVIWMVRDTYRNCDGLIGASNIPLDTQTQLLLKKKKKTDK